MIEPGRARSLQRRLFVSHLLVMVVALAVLVAGVVLVVSLVRVAGWTELFDTRSPGSSQPSGFENNDGPPAPVLLVPLVAAVVAAGLVSWRMTRRIAAPVEAARTATRRLAGGSYDVRVDGGSIAELAELADDINHLADELDATERRRLRLIGDVAHELRNPLATIEASMEALMDGVVPADDETFTRIAREAARLRRLAGDLSDLSAASEPSSVHLDEAVDLVEVVSQVVAQLAPQAEAKQLDLVWAPPGTSPTATVTGDRDRLIQVLINVVGNAIQYTDTGSVTIALHRFEGGSPTGSDPDVVVTVSDTGRGLVAADQRQVFERFYRVRPEPSPDRHAADAPAANPSDEAAGPGEGTGVGLAIARAVVGAHGGTITARSRGLGQGSTFEIRLPAPRR